MEKSFSLVFTCGSKSNQHTWTKLFLLRKETLGLFFFSLSTIYSLVLNEPERGNTCLFRLSGSHQDLQDASSQRFRRPHCDGIRPAVRILPSKKHSAFLLLNCETDRGLPFAPSRACPPTTPSTSSSASTWSRPTTSTRWTSTARPTPTSSSTSARRESPTRTTTSPNSWTPSSESESRKACLYIINWLSILKRS